MTIDISSEIDAFFARMGDSQHTLLMQRVAKSIGLSDVSDLLLLDEDDSDMVTAFHIETIRMYADNLIARATAQGVLSAVGIQKDGSLDYRFNG